MPELERVTREHVLQVLEEYDTIGSIDFLGRYGFGRSRDHLLHHEGNAYDSKAVLGVAHLRATGALVHDVPGGREAAAALLRALGFSVDGPARAAARPSAAPRATSSRSAAPRTTATARRATAQERPVAVCPTCFQQLPATGSCDNCA